MSNENPKYLNQPKKQPSKTTAFFVCVVIAAGLWLVHALNTVYTYSIKIPVTFKNIPQTKIALNELPIKLNVDVKASGLKLVFVVFNKIKPIEIDFNDLKTSNKQQNYILSASTLNFKSVLKFEMQVKQISPDTLYFTERSGSQKNVAVKVPLQLKCEQGYGFKTPLISPNFISIWGDSSILKNIDTICTEVLSATQLNKSFTKELGLIKPNSSINFNQLKINVNVEVDKLIEESVLVPISIANADEFKQVNIFPQKVKIKFTSLQNSFNRADTGFFKASIKAIKSNSTQQLVTLSSMPSNVTVLSIVPNQVEVLLIKK